MEQNVIDQINDEFGEDFRTAPAKGGGDVEVPDEIYNVEITAIRHEQLGQNKRSAVVWEFVVLDGDYEGAFIRKVGFYGKGTAYIKQDLAKAGIIGDTPAEVDAQFAGAISRWVEIRVKTKGDYTNIYINKVLDQPPRAAGAGAGDGEGDISEDENLPF